MDINEKAYQYFENELKVTVENNNKSSFFADSIISTALIIIATITTVVGENVNNNVFKAIMTIIPIMLILIIALFCSSFYRMMIYGGYRKALEEEIVYRNELNVNTWEKYTTQPKNFFCIESCILYILLSILAVGIFQYAIKYVKETDILIYNIELYSGIGMLIFYVFLLLFLGSRKYKKTYNYFSESFKKSRERNIINI